MGWFRRRSAEDRAEQRSTLQNPDSWLVNSLVGPEAISGERVTEKAALGLATVFSAVEKISEQIGSLPLKVYRAQDDGARVEARSHRMWKILHDKPNDYSIAHSFWSTVAASMLLRGNAYALKDFDANDEVEALWLLDPATMQVEYDGTTKRFVQYTYAGQKRVYSTDEVVHFMGFSLDGIVGCSRIEYCRQTLGNTLGRHRFEAEFYAQGAHVPGVIQYPGVLGEQGLLNLSNTFKFRHTGKGNRHKVPVLEEGATFQGIGMSLADMQFVEQAQLSRTEIAVMFNLPPAYLGGSTGDSLTYATAESNQIQFATMAVSPLTSRIAKTLTADPQILPWNVMYCEFVLEAMLKADMRTRVEYWKALKDMGVVDEAYIAERENLPKPPPKPKPVAPPPPQPDAQLNGQAGAPQGAFSLPAQLARTNGG